MSEKMLAWEKWDDDIIEQDGIGEINMQGMTEEEAEATIEILQKIPKLVSTPMGGIYQLHDRFSPSKQFNCWIGHTNFNVTRSVIESIEEVEGIEVLFPVSRYKFFMGVGKLFDFKNTRLNIENILCDKHKFVEDNIDLDEETRVKVKNIKKKLNKKNNWAIFIFPNGEIDYISSDKQNDQTYLDTLRLYLEASNFSGGILLTKEEEI